MTSRLSSDTIAQMAPLLGSLSRLVARGSQLSEVQLRTLLRGIDLEAEPALMQEEKFWMELLQNFREDPSEEMRQVTVEALLLRGLPEASALLAVSTVADGTSKGKTLKVSQERLDFGQLAAGQIGTIEFEVEGGPGQVVVENDQLRVAPVQFSSQKTRIRVEVKPLAGGLLWTSLKLMTSGETLEVPVLAQSEEVSYQASYASIASSQTSHKTKKQWLEEGDYHYKANRFADALAAFEEAIRLDPNDATVYNGQGNALDRLNRYEEALAAFEQAIRLDSHFADAFRGKGYIRENFNRYEEALAAFEQAIRLDSHFADAFRGKGDQLVRLNRKEESIAAYKEAITLYEQNIQRNTNDALAYYGKGKALNGLERYEEALEAYEQAIHINSKYAPAWHGKSQALWKLNRNDEALTISNYALRLDPGYLNAHNIKGLVLRQLKRYAEALVSHEHALRLNPKNVILHLNKGSELHNLKRYEEALVIYEQAIRLDPIYAFTYDWKGTTLCSLNRYEEALTSYEQAIRLDPKNCGYFNQRGNTYYSLERYEEALIAYEQAIQLDPDNALYHSNKGYALTKLNRHQEALVAFEQAIRLDLNNDYLYIWKGVTLYSLDRYDAALPAFEKAIQLNPNDAVYHYNKGNTLSKLNRHQEALGAFERAMQLDSKYTKNYNDTLELVNKSKGTSPSSGGVQTSVSGADSFNKFTESARKVLSLAQEEAQRFQHNYIGTEHLLLGLVREGDGVAAKVLSNSGVQLNKVRSAVEFIIGRGDRIVLGEIGLTPRAKKVIELSVDEARRLNHHYIGTEHLLLGLVREGEGIAAGVLESLGVNLEKVRTETIRVLNQSK